MRTDPTKQYADSLEARIAALESFTQSVDVSSRITTSNINVYALKAYVSCGWLHLYMHGVMTSTAAGANVLTMPEDLKTAYEAPVFFGVGSWANGNAYCGCLRVDGGGNRAYVNNNIGLSSTYVRVNIDYPLASYHA